MPHPYRGQQAVLEERIGGLLTGELQGMESNYTINKSVGLFERCTAVEREKIAGIKRPQ